MPRLNFDEDIKPLSEFRAHAAALLQRVRETGRPLVLTQRGRSAAVVVGVGDSERLLGELEILREVRTAEDQLDRGEGIAHEEVKKRVLARLQS